MNDQQDQNPDTELTPIATETDPSTTLQTLDLNILNETAEQEFALNNSHAESLQAFFKNFELLTDAEGKIKEALEFMRFCLLQENGPPYFKGFWQARQLCLPLFKENITSSARTELWNDYRNLCQESQRLKQILEEQSAFAIEQIDLAIQSLEKEIELIPERLTKIQEIDFPAPSKILQHKENFYKAVQKELQLLNVYASRINALRKELIKTEMRIRQKNKFFKQLSSAGDRIFPRRKELIKELSCQFIEDIEAFTKEHFNQGVLKLPLFFYRDEIKALQSIAKILTLNTHAFSLTRQILSKCWDSVKDVEKDRKKVRAEQKAHFHQALQAVMNQIEDFKKAWSDNTLSLDEAQKQIDHFFHTVQGADVGRDEKRQLREAILEAQKPISDKLKEENDSRVQKEQEILQEKKAQMTFLQQQFENLIAGCSELSQEDLSIQRDCLIQQVRNAPMSKTEKQHFDKYLKQLKDIACEKKMQSIMSLPSDELQTLQELHSMLEQQKTRRKEVRALLEEYRKVAGSSSLSFEKAITYNEMVQTEKARLEKIDEAIAELVNKIAALEG